MLEYYSGKRFDFNEKVTAITGIYDKLKIKEEAETLMLEYYDKAVNDLDAISVPDERKAIIRDFTLMLNVRKL